MTAPHVTTEGLYRWKAINKVGRHVGLDFYDLLIEGDYTRDRSDLCRVNFEVNNLKPFPHLAFPHFLTFKMLRNSLVLMAS